MSKLLEEATNKYNSWLKVKPPIAPPKDRYTYEEACQVMWHDGANNAYYDMINLIKKHEKEA